MKDDIVKSYSKQTLTKQMFAEIIYVVAFGDSTYLSPTYKIVHSILNAAQFTNEMGALQFVKSYLKKQKVDYINERPFIAKLSTVEIIEV